MYREFQLKAQMAELNKHFKEVDISWKYPFIDLTYRSSEREAKMKKTYRIGSAKDLNIYSVWHQRMKGRGDDVDDTSAEANKANGCPTR
ncbi:hypothetical protein Hypma_000361 [Hypsizygus marmoreus]|uniref:Uncharacterized protein n=1 Tax=Hypsizygus marmoreus TaxID=39966 RepID=A0A369J912_HYPMA|nr:hypothetical protein Hypma_000361 [Hypsizygus marmoreus]